MRLSESMIPTGLSSLDELPDGLASVQLDCY